MTKTSPAALPEPGLRFENCARDAARAFGDVAVVTMVEDGGDCLVTIAAAHRDAERERLARAVLGERYRPGEALPGCVWQADRGILLMEVDSPALARTAPPAYESKRYVKAVGLQSIMIVPIREGGRVVGTLGVARDPGHPPYTEDEFLQLEAMASWDSRSD